MYTIPFDYRQYDPAAALNLVPPEFRADLPLRAKSVSLSKRPESSYGRPVQSADFSTRMRYNQKLFHRRLAQTAPERPVLNKMPIKQQNRKTKEKVPCAVSVQTLSLPTRYADEPKALPTSKCGYDTKTKYCNPLKQVSDNRRQRQAAPGATGTANRLLLQINEAEQVDDFERILNSNAILRVRAQGNLWRRAEADVPSASVRARPRSTYSLRSVSHAYQHLFKQHEDSLQPLIESYRRAAAAAAPPCPPQSLLVRPWYEDLKDLSEFYEDDSALKREIETITDRIVAEEVKAIEEASPSRTRNFQVNLAGLIGLRVHGETLSPVHQDGDDDEGKEWLTQSMSADDSSKQEAIEHLAENLNEVTLDSDEKLPKITFSNCCEACPRTEQPNSAGVVVHLTVPSVQSDEARPPMM